MNASTFNAEENQPRLKVSVTARLIAALCYIIPALGGALSSILLMSVFRALRNNESAGINTVMRAMKEAALPSTVSLYLAAICGFAVIVVLVVRMIVETRTASPPSWFFFIGGILWLIPVGLFWKAELLILEVLSPGSSIGVSGAESVGADVAQLLMLSLIAVPVVFIILVVASVVPFSSRSKPKWSPLIAATAIEILLIASAVAIPFLIDEPKRKQEMVNLPVNIKYSDIDNDIDKETSMVLTLTSDNKLYERRADKTEKTVNIITKEELPEKLKKFSAAKTPDKRIVYIKADVNASNEDVLQVFDIIRKAGIDKIGLVVVGEKNSAEPIQIYLERFEVRLPQPTDKTTEAVRPNPLTLVVMLDKDGILMLNREDTGRISETELLKNKLDRIFKERESNGVFREGTNEVEKTVFLKVSKSGKYGDFIKLVEAVKGARAEPIGIQIEEVNL